MTTDQMPLTDAEVQAILARAEAAPPGPYEWEDRLVFDGAGMVESGKPYNLQTRVYQDAFKSVVNPDGQSHPMVWLKTLDGWEPSQELAAFIAAARQDVPALVRDLQAARETITQQAEDSARLDYLEVHADRVPWPPDGSVREWIDAAQGAE